LEAPSDPLEEALRVFCFRVTVATAFGAGCHAATLRDVGRSDTPVVCTQADSIAAISTTADSDKARRRLPVKGIMVAPRKSHRQSRGELWLNGGQMWPFPAIIR
jgi:hypothetical protein